MKDEMCIIIEWYGSWHGLSAWFVVVCRLSVQFWMMRGFCRYHLKSTECNNPDEETEGNGRKRKRGFSYAQFMRMPFCLIKIQNSKYDPPLGTLLFPPLGTLSSTLAAFSKRALEAQAFNIFSNKTIIFGEIRVILFDAHRLCIRVIHVV